jgi:DAK2 domain fusion protein YloV
VLEALDAGEVRRWAAACVQALEAHREAIDRINVYPVADNDTGSNLLFTMRAGLDRLLSSPGVSHSLLESTNSSGGTAAAAVAALAKGALSGARGNSGVIVSQFLRGFAEAVADADKITGPDLRTGLIRGAVLATAAVSTPTPGTMLTVLDGAAAAGAVTTANSLSGVVQSAARGAAEALANTPRQLAVLAEAGVVDAGGRGIVVLLDALVAVVSGRSAALAAAAQATAELGNPLVARREDGSDEYSYEVMYLLEGSTNSAAVLRDELVTIGDSVSVVGGGEEDLWTVHVHCNDVGAAIEAGIDAGRPRKIRVARFDDAPPPETRFTQDRAVVAPVRSAELAELLVNEGIAALHVDEPNVYQLLEVITGTKAAHVAVLPIDRGLIEIADEAAIRAVAAGQDVVVVPCSSPVQVLAAVAVHDPRRRAGDDVVRMAEAAALTRRGEVNIAEGDAITWVGRCREGDILGFADGEVALIEPGPPDVDALDRVARGVIGRMLSMGGELVTVLLGAEASDDLVPELEDYLRVEHPEADLVVYRGGQTDAVLHIGIE